MFHDIDLFLQEKVSEKRAGSNNQVEVKEISKWRKTMDDTTSEVGEESSGRGRWCRLDRRGRNKTEVILLEYLSLAVTYHLWAVDIGKGPFG